MQRSPRARRVGRLLGSAVIGGVLAAVVTIGSAQAAEIPEDSGLPSSVGVNAGNTLGVQLGNTLDVQLGNTLGIQFGNTL